MRVELHRHLDASVQPELLLKLAKERGLISPETSLLAFKNQWIIQEPLADLSAVLARFTLFQKVLDRADVLERVAREVVGDCWKEGSESVELRYCPSFVSEHSQLSWEESLNAFQRGIQQGLQLYPAMKAGLICIALRDSGPEEVDRTVDFFLKHQNQFIGLDLAGNEGHFPCRLFESSFKKAIQRQANITIHAGEASGPDSIWEAIELLGAKRIGHGVASIQDPKLVNYLIEKQICLEMCPTSNYLTRAVPSLSDHPLPQLLRAGVPVSINTDDPGIFGVTLEDEFQICRKEMGMTSEELSFCQEHARKASFL
jgi:adenosine deaminase